eukprot:15034868-Alexandrium_andersonii.AAC.1
MITRLFLAEARPRRAGNVEFGTVGVSYVPWMGVPSPPMSATGSTQSRVHFWPPPPPRGVSAGPRSAGI